MGDRKVLLLTAEEQAGESDEDGEPATRGRIVGVLGGYQEGGSTAGVSYSAYLGRAIRQLYRQATA